LTDIKYWRFGNWDALDSSLSVYTNDIKWYHDRICPMIADVPVRLRGLEKRKADVMDAFTKCTKDDVSLNNFLARAKNL